MSVLGITKIQRSHTGIAKTSNTNTSSNSSSSSSSSSTIIKNIMSVFVFPRKAPGPFPEFATWVMEPEGGGPCFFQVFNLENPFICPEHPPLGGGALLVKTQKPCFAWVLITKIREGDCTTINTNSTTN